MLKNQRIWKNVYKIHPKAKALGFLLQGFSIKLGAVEGRTKGANKMKSYVKQVAMLNEMVSMTEHVEDNLIIKWRTGSYMYGTTTPDSDEDFLGVCIPPKDFVLGIHKFEQYQEKTNPASSGKCNTKEDTDLTIYSLPKFLHLLAENNPNIIELLYAHKNCILNLTPFGQKLIDNRDMFLSLRVKHKFSGYAYSQRHKMKRSSEVYTTLYGMGFREDNINDISEDMKDSLKKLDLKSGSRLKLIMKYGYDTKFASHLIRLFYFGIELLKEGNLSLPTKHNNYLLDIKKGRYSLEEILKKADELEQLTEMAYLSSKLPHTPDMEKINQFQIEMLESFWRTDGLFI